MNDEMKKEIIMSDAQNSSFIVPTSSLVVPTPLPKIDINVRSATMDDLSFIDGLQKKHSKQLGFFPRAQMEGYIKSEWVLIAESVVGGQCLVAGEETPATSHQQPVTRLGYCASRDRYLKRDELGAVFQLCIEPGKQRGLIGANLLKAVFERASYGTKLFCCWCAQDLDANHFWKAMGFIPLAFRTGSRSRGKNASPRVHIFWEKRIRSEDTTTPWWFPSQTTGGSIREDRLVLPIPPGVHWKDVMPVVLPGEDQQKSLPAPTPRKKVIAAKPKEATNISRGGMYIEIPKPPQQIKTAEPRKKIKNDPKFVAAARELRDRWLEQVNANPALMECGKYEVSRLANPHRPIDAVRMIAA